MTFDDAAALTPEATAPEDLAAAYAELQERFARFADEVGAERAARTADSGGLREAWLAGWAAYKDDESWAFNQSPEQVAGHADAYVRALTPEATAPDTDR